MDWQPLYYNVLRPQRDPNTGKALADQQVYTQIPFNITPMGVQDVVMSELPITGQGQRLEWWQIMTCWPNGQPYLPKPTLLNGDKIVDNSQVNAYTGQPLTYVVHDFADRVSFLVMQAWTPAGLPPGQGAVAP